MANDRSDLEKIRAMLSRAGGYGCKAEVVLRLWQTALASPKQTLAEAIWTALFANTATHGMRPPVTNDTTARPEDATHDQQPPDLDAFLAGVVPYLEEQWQMSPWGRVEKLLAQARALQREGQPQPADERTET